MDRFSERIGVVKPDRVLQVDSMGDALRNSLWNLFLDLYDDPNERYWRPVAKHIAMQFRKVPADELPFENYRLREWVKEHFFGLRWYQAYDLVEFVVHNHTMMTTIHRARGYPDTHRISTDQLITGLNRILERELSGFRFIQGALAPITDPAEVAEVEDAAKATQRVGLYGAQEHIRVAVGLLGKKPEPDYRNAIKEAISAVESVAKQFAGSDSATLDAALKELSSKIELHGALKAGFSNLYGFTSDESGVRHAILEQPSVGFAEAKYMIVACSAFVNYLLVKAEQAGLLK